MKQLAFLVGFQRSGTTSLQRILGGHPEVGTAQESHLFDQFLTPAMRRWDRQISVDTGRGGVGLPAYLTGDEFEALLRGVAERVLSKADEYRRKPVFLDKTPDHVKCVDLIHRLFPEARIILMIRRPEDCVESLLAASRSWGRNWAPRSAWRAAHDWRRSMRLALRHLELVPEDRKLLLRFEDLKEDPPAEVGRVLDFLGVDSDPRLVESLCETPSELRKYGHFAEESGNLVVDPEGFHREKKGKLSPLKTRLVRFVCRKFAREFGY